MATIGDIFRAYDIRGRYPDELDTIVAKQIGAGFVRLLNAKRVVVGRDMRLSSTGLATAFIEGATSEGADVSDAGMVSTPLFDYTLIDGNYDGGAMVTASHLPAEVNGFKLSRSRGIPVSADTGLSVLEEYVRHPPSGTGTRPVPGVCSRISTMEQYIKKISSLV